MSIPDPNMVHFKPNLSGKFTDGNISIIALYQQKMVSNAMIIHDTNIPTLIVILYQFKGCKNTNSNRNHNTKKNSNHRDHNTAYTTS